MEALSVFPAVGAYITVVQVALAVLLAVTFVYVALLVSSYIVGSLVEERVAEHSIDDRNNASTFVFFIASVWAPFVALFNTLGRALTALYSHITANLALYATLLLSLVFVLSWQFANVQLWQAWTTIYTIFFVRIVRPVLMQFVLVFKLGAETVVPLINWLIRISTSLVTGTLYDGTTCSAQTVWAVISQRLVDAVLQFALALSDWLVQVPADLVRSVPDFSQFGRAFALALGSFQVFFSCVCASVSTITQPLFDGLANGTYTSFRNNPCPELNAPVPGISSTGCAAQALVEFPFAVVGDLARPWQSLAEDGTFVSWYNEVSINTTVDTAYSFVNCTASIPDDVLRSYYYYFVDLAIEPEDVICTVSVDAPRIHVHSRANGLLEESGTALSMPGPPPTIFGCVAPYLWLGYPGGSGLTALLRSPEAWKLTVNLAFNLNTAFESWDGQLLFRIDSVYDLALQVLDCACDIVRWIGDIFNLISTALNDDDAGACTGIGADGVVSGAFSCVFELVNSGLRLVCCAAETMLMWIIDGLRQLWTQIVGFFYTMVTNGIAEGMAVHPCDANPIEDSWENYCTVPKTTTWFLDYAQFAWGDRVWANGDNYCDEDFCARTLECRSDVDCRGLGDDSIRVCDVGFTNRCIYTENRDRPCPNNGTADGQQCTAPFGNQCAVGQCVDADDDDESGGSCNLLLDDDDEPIFEQACDCECPVNTLRRWWLLALQAVQCVEEFIITLFGSIVQTVTCFIMQLLRIVLELVLFVIDIVAHLDPIVIDPTEFDFAEASQPLVLSVQQLILCASDGICNASPEGSCKGVELDEDIKDFLLCTSEGVDVGGNNLLNITRVVVEFTYELFSSVKTGDTLDFGLLDDLFREIIADIISLIGVLVKLFGTLVNYAIPAFDQGGLGTLIKDVGQALINAADTLTDILIDVIVIILRYVFGFIEAIFFGNFTPLFEVIEDTVIWILENSSSGFRCFIDGWFCLFGQDLLFPDECKDSAGCDVACFVNDFVCFFGPDPVIPVDPAVMCNYTFCGTGDGLDVILGFITDIACLLNDVIEALNTVIPGDGIPLIDIMCPEGGALNVKRSEPAARELFIAFLNDNAPRQTAAGRCSNSLLPYQNHTWPLPLNIMDDWSVQSHTCVQLHNSVYRQLSSGKSLSNRSMDIPYAVEFARQSSLAIGRRIAKTAATIAAVPLKHTANRMRESLAVHRLKAQQREAAWSPEQRQQMTELRTKLAEASARINFNAVSLDTLPVKKIGKKLVSAAKRVYNDDTNYVSWLEKLYNHQYIGRLLRLGSRRVVEARLQNHLDPDEQCDVRTSPFECCPTQTVCLDCSFFDRTLWAAQDGSELMVNYYTGDYRTRFIGCSEYLANTAHQTSIPTDDRCPVQVCALPECTRDEQCADAAQNVPAFCNVEFGRCALNETQCAGNLNALCYTQDALGDTGMLGQCNVLGDDPVCVPSTSFAANCQCPDTYLTEKKRVPSILERLFTVRWFWQWDYAAFLERIDPDDTIGDADDNPHRGQLQPALTNNGTEPNLHSDIILVLDALSAGLGTAFSNITEDLRQVASSTAANPSIISNAANELLFCDFDEDYYNYLNESATDNSNGPCCSDLCEQRLQGLGSLFDGLANAFLLFSIPILVATLCPLCSPPMALVVFLISLLGVFPLAQAISYGGGVLCYVSGFTFVIAAVLYFIAWLLNRILRVFCCGTVRAVLVTAVSLLAAFAVLVAPLPGASVSLGPDVYTLTSELLSPCTYLPVELVDRSSAASTTVCGSIPDQFDDFFTVELPDIHDCLTTDRLEPTRFKDFGDNLLYWAEQWDEGFNERLAARTLDTPLAAVGRRALQHTTEAHQLAGPLADACARWTAPNVLLTPFLILAGLVALLFGGAIIVLLSNMIFPLAIAALGSVRLLVQMKQALWYRRSEDTERVLPANDGDKKVV